MYFDADRNAYVDNETNAIVFQEGDVEIGHDEIYVDQDFSSPIPTFARPSGSSSALYAKVRTPSSPSSDKNSSALSPLNLSLEEELIHMHMSGGEPHMEGDATPGFWDDWTMARTLQAMEFEIMRPQEEGDFNEKEYRASRSCRRQLATLSCFIVVVQIALLVAMVQTDGYDPKNPVIGPPIEAMVRYGAKEAGLIKYKNEWWRLLGSVMLHGGIFHIIPNGAIQLRVGGYLNLVYGTWKWFIIYFASGIFGSMMSCVFLPNSVGVGSSGAVMGMLTSWVVWIVFRWEKIPPECRSQRNCQLFIVVASVVVTLATSFTPNVDWAAHAGGSLQGLLWGIVLLSSELDNTGSQLWLRISAGTVAIFLIAFSLYWIISVLEPSKDNFEYWDSNDDWN